MHGLSLFIRNNWKWILLLVIALILILYIRRNWYKFSHLFTPRNIDLEPGESEVISEQRKRQIESIAQKLFTDIYNTPYSGHNGDVYKEALSLTDNELLYLAKFYKRSVSGGNTLYADIDSQWYVWIDSPTTLMARLNKIGEGA